MLDPRAWLEGLSTPVTVGWAVWLVWSLALVGWYRYALVAPKGEPRVAAPGPPALPVRALETDPTSFDQPEPFGQEAPNAGVDLRRPPAQIDWSTADTAPAMRPPRRRPVDAEPAAGEAAAHASPQVPAPARAAYQFTTHRQDDVSAPQR